jgi:hypothetical protein
MKLIELGWVTRTPKVVEALTEIKRFLLQH